tara:strand:+ start:353 stop:523 length:171 start_codon:yes stop_codon:yes gene_type:complete
LFTVVDIFSREARREAQAHDSGRKPKTENREPKAQKSVEVCENETMKELEAAKLKR